MCKNKPYRKKKENMYLGCASVILQGSKHHSCSQQVMSGGTRSSQAQRTRVLILKKLLINSKNLLFNLKHTGPVGPPLQVHLCEPMWGLQPGMDLYIVGLEGCVAREAPEMVLHCSQGQGWNLTVNSETGRKIYGKEQQKGPLNINTLQEAKFGDNIYKLSCNSLGEMLLLWVQLKAFLQWLPSQCLHILLLICKYH